MLEYVSLKIWIKIPLPSLIKYLLFFLLIWLWLFDERLFGLSFLMILISFLTSLWLDSITLSISLSFSLSIWSSSSLNLFWYLCSDNDARIWSSICSMWFLNLNLRKNKYSHWIINFTLKYRNKTIANVKKMGWWLSASSCSNSIPQNNVIHPASIAWISIVLYSILFIWLDSILYTNHRPKHSNRC